MATTATKLEANFDEVNFGFDWMVASHGVSMQFAGRDLMRVYCNNLLQLSWPKNKKAGKGAIDADTNKIFAPLDSQEAIGFFNSIFGDGTYTKGGKLKGQKRQARAQSIMPGVTFNWRGDQSAMRKWHEERRRRGKVPRGDGSVRRGKWTFERGMYVTTTAMRKYRRARYKSVGKLKAGWAKAALYFAAATNGRLVMPAFVRDQDQKRGTKQDAFTRDGNGFATATNLIPYASRLTRFIIGRATRKTEHYASKATQKQIDKIVARYNSMEGRPPPVQVIK